MSELLFPGWKIEAHVDAAPNAVFFPRQIHGHHIIDARKTGETRSTADGVIVRSKGAGGGIVTADCLPLILMTETRALALHVSRKTLICGLLDAASDHLADEKIVAVYLGPHICEEHFSFSYAGSEIAAFAEHFPAATSIRDGTYHLSLRRACDRYFSAWNITSKIIVEDTRCTVENEALPSYRRQLAQGSERKKLSQLLTSVQPR